MTETDRELATVLGALHLEMSAIYAEVSRAFELTAQQVELLCQLNGASPSLGELARALGCDKSNITGMADRLARRGLVRREADPYDRRISRLTRTEQGEALGEAMEAAIAQRVGERCVGLSAADRQQLIALSRRALAALGKIR
ncbi:MarR family winged helix-turn-helix transcriptional regulator [Streptomyces akebiae]|uniref:MarR family transcriptional regulator n=1 Tax=Streptomyces akebiae TaxID=2865673 RepID=A0ABX8XLF3_9ACTN|nr:MarR family transcriptional regulator [Streptomyces akebiae]QYX76584.1 MarR family transcriptional regulator [Streptomyces akebiae]